MTLCQCGGVCQDGGELRRLCGGGSREDQGTVLFRKSGLGHYPAGEGRRLNPVIGNGDIFTPQDAGGMIGGDRMRRIHGGQGRQGESVAVRRINHYLDTGDSFWDLPWLKIKAMILRHGRMLVQFKANTLPCVKMRGHVAWYTKGMPQFIFPEEMKSTRWRHWRNFVEERFWTRKTPVKS